MRLVAVTVLVLAGLATMPVAPAINECHSPCQTVVVPSSPANARSTTYYLYLQGLTCDPRAHYCQGQPDPIVTGFLYEETNCEGGLQRYETIHCRGDRLVLL